MNQNHFLSHHKIKLIRFISLLLILLLLADQYLGIPRMNDDNKGVSILTWWGYLDTPEIKQLSNACQVNIQLTEIYSSEQFIQSFKEQRPYDISIYPADLYPNYKQAFPELGKTITQITKEYHPKIKAQYNQQAFSEDTLYFQHAVMLFLSNKAIDQKTFDLEHLFEGANQGRVILPNSFELIDRLLEQGNPTVASQYWDKLKIAVQNGSIELSDFGTSVYGKDFSLAYQVSGELLNPNITWPSTKDNDGNLSHPEISLHPKYSFVASDILSLNSHSQTAYCIATHLASQEFLKHISNTNFYFSPFGDSPEALTTNSPELDFFGVADQLFWLAPKHRNNYSPKAVKAWEAIQSTINNQTNNSL
jgi:hypothetical protein